MIVFWGEKAYRTARAVPLAIEAELRKRPGVWYLHGSPDGSRRTAFGSRYEHAMLASVSLLMKTL
jgi:hypothetical protein